MQRAVRSPEQPCAYQLHETDGVLPTLSHFALLLHDFQNARKWPQSIKIPLDVSSRRAAAHCCCVRASIVAPRYKAPPNAGNVSEK